MLVFEKIEDLRIRLKSIRSTQSIGLVPTMGALHDGHLSLIKEAKLISDVVVATIFVNPTQFNKPEDLENYPSNLKQDLDLLNRIGADIVFTPSQSEIYPAKPQLKMSFGAIESQLEGKFRPGHFAGVGQVVSKLFNIVQPDKAFFGQKDLQQFFVISSLVEELNFPIELKMVPTKREDSGLALSSRNQRLSRGQKEEASLLYKALSEAKELLLSGKPISHVKIRIEELFQNSSSLELEYFEVVQTDNFKPLEETEQDASVALCIAAEIGEVRLIDNILLNA